MKKGNVLIVLTSHGELGDTGKATGFHYEEMTTPYLRLREAGYHVSLASIAGGKPPHDPGSLKESPEENPDSVVSFLKDETALHQLNNTPRVDDMNAAMFDGIYLPGGHGTMWDFPSSPALARLVSECYRDGKPVAAVCHGIAGLLEATTPLGQPIIADKRINCFTNAEEEKLGLEAAVPFLLETAVRELGGKFECAEPFEGHVAVDGNLITGQNPASLDELSQELIGQLDERSRGEESSRRSASA